MVFYGELDLKKLVNLYTYDVCPLLYVYLSNFLKVYFKSEAATPVTLASGLKKKKKSLPLSQQNSHLLCEGSLAPPWAPLAFNVHTPLAIACKAWPLSVARGPASLCPLGAC